MNGIERIAAERQRQIEGEDYLPEHDLAHHKAELARAAAVYALPPEERHRAIWKSSLLVMLWPADWRIKESTDRVRELEKAGALIAAEIDRLLAVRAWAETPSPCACSPGDICTCSFDCACRERDTHEFVTDSGWMNIASWVGRAGADGGERRG